MIAGGTSPTIGEALGSTGTTGGVRVGRSGGRALVGLGVALPAGAEADDWVDGDGCEDGDGWAAAEQPATRATVASATPRAAPRDRGMAREGIIEGILLPRQTRLHGRRFPRRLDSSPMTHHYTVLHGGTVLTLDGALPTDAATRAAGAVGVPDAAGRRATAICYAHERILAVGTDEEMLALAGPDSTVVDLRGRAVVPGFVEPHAHPYWEGVVAGMALVAGRERRAALRAVPGAGEHLPPDAWLVARYDPTGWDRPDDPTRDDLDRAVPDRPVLLAHVSGHGVAANSLALAIAGIDAVDGRTSAGSLRDRAGRRRRADRRPPGAGRLGRLRGRDARADAGGRGGRPGPSGRPPGRRRRHQRRRRGRRLDGRRRGRAGGLGRGRRDRAPCRWRCRSCPGSSGSPPSPARGSRRPRRSRPPCRTPSATGSASAT